eukprot:TRINITY_DN2990_c0_g1_i1.p1 TRINITY_DN2990_c0_g1~~TRINITY_DN2990_c0_g1_i1.p1  ORF type:complete len:476 (+),score=24.90 TRINITY_DN2990_c0_g1_i1:100-1428(+)
MAIFALLTQKASSDRLNDVFMQQGTRNGQYHSFSFYQSQVAHSVYVELCRRRASSYHRDAAFMRQVADQSRSCNVRSVNLLLTRFREHWETAKLDNEQPVKSNDELYSCLYDVSAAAILSGLGTLAPTPQKAAARAIRRLCCHTAIRSDTLNYMLRSPTEAFCRHALSEPVTVISEELDPPAHLIVEGAMIEEKLAQLDQLWPMGLQSVTIYCSEYNQVVSLPTCADLSVQCAGDPIPMTLRTTQSTTFASLTLYGMGSLEWIVDQPISIKELSCEAELIESLRCTSESITVDIIAFLDLTPHVDAELLSVLQTRFLVPPGMNSTLRAMIPCRQWKPWEPQNTMLPPGFVYNFHFGYVRGRAMISDLLLLPTLWEGAGLRTDAVHECFLALTLGLAVYDMHPDELVWDALLNALLMQVHRDINNDTTGDEFSKICDWEDSWW